MFLYLGSRGRMNPTAWMVMVDGVADSATGGGLHVGAGHFSRQIAALH